MLQCHITANQKNTVVQQISNDVSAATGRIFSKPVNATRNIFESVNELLDTYEENQQLKKKINGLSTMQTKISVLEKENEKLKLELELDETLIDYHTIPSTVIARNPDGWIDQLIIDRGSQNGLEVNMSVLSENGLIGRIIEVNPTNSKVQLLTTTNQSINHVSAELLSTEGEAVNGVITGYEEETNRLIMSQITTDAQIEEGQEVITSGLGGVTPRSLNIGTVDQVLFDRFGLSQEVYIKPATDFSDIRYVTVVFREAGSVNE